MEARPVRVPPQAPGYGPLGNAFELYRDPHAFMLKSYLTLGPVYRAGGFNRYYTVLAGPEANRWFLRSGERVLDNQPLYEHIAAELGADNYPIATTGERHHHLRRTLRPALAPDVLQPHVPWMFARIRRVAAGFRSGDQVSVLEVMHALLGTSSVRRCSAERWATGYRTRSGFARCSVGSGLGGYPREMLWAPRYLLAKRRMLALMRELLAWHRAHPPGAQRSPDFMDALLSTCDHGGQPLSDEDVIANAQMAYSNTLLYVGPACAFLLYCLLKHSGVLAEVRDELAGAARGAGPDLAALQALPTLNAAVVESMRMHPIGLATPRVVAEAFEYDGYRLPRGEVVLVAGTVCHFLPQVFPEPYRFDPSRCRPPRDEHRQVVSESASPPFVRRIRYATRLPWPFRARRFTVEQVFEPCVGACVLGSWSVDAPWDELTAATVEGRVVYSGYRIERAASGCRLQRIVAIDLHAWIPGLDAALQRHYRQDHARLAAPLSPGAAAELRGRMHGAVYDLLDEVLGQEKPRLTLG